MAFKGLEDRFNAKVTKLYDGTARDSGVGAPSDEPYLEFSPLHPDARETTHDSRVLPIGSTKRDIVRLGRFLKSDRGLRFMASEALMQSANAFSETRIYNPLFIIGNAVPYVHLGRNLSNPSDFSIDDDTKSPASSVDVGRAGRLQKHTANAAKAKVAGTTGKSSLLSILSPLKLVSTISNVFSVATGGSTGVDQRPEMDVAGTLYSVALWQGFQKQQSPASSLKAAKADLRTGNVSGALKNIAKAAKDFVVGIRPRGLGQLSAPQGRNDPTNSDMAGRRFFITDKNTGADRYLVDSVVFDADRRPEVSLEALEHRISAIRGQAPSIPGGVQTRGGSDTEPRTTASSIASIASFAKGAESKAPGFFSTLKKNVQKTIEKAKKDIQAEAQRADRRIDGAIRKAIPEAAGFLDRQIKLPKLSPPNTSPEGGDNPAEDRMLFPELSLRRQYLDSDRVKAVKDLLAEQRSTAKKYWEDNVVDRGWGGTNALTPGQDAIIDSMARNPSPSYFVDYSNLQSVFTRNQGDSITDDTIKQIRAKMGEDLINVFFYDFVNRNTIPFRAFVSNINEVVMPEVSDTRYIGRIDRNVVYVGVSRELSFQLHVQAFSSEELAVIWRKISYITGLCYPSRYDQFGFMIPPFVKLTLGDLWRDQPGYLKSVSHTIDDNAVWEITEDSQAPHSATINLTFAILEKTQMDSGGLFYPVGVSRSIARNAPSAGQLPDQEKTNLGTPENRPIKINAITEGAKTLNGLYAASKQIQSVSNRVKSALSFGGGFGNVG